MQQLQQKQTLAPKHALTREEARRGIPLPLCFALLWGFLLFSGASRWSMTVMNGVLFTLYTAQAIGAIRNYLRVRRGETVLVLAPPPSPLYMLWALGTVAGAASAAFAFLGALLTVLMVLTGAAFWYLPPLLLSAGVLLTILTRLSWRKLRATQATHKPTPQETAPPTTPTENTGRWWTRNDARD